MDKKYLYILAAALLWWPVSALAQSYEPYIPENEMPDVVKIVPAPPQDPSPDFDHDILRYMWGKQQRKDPARLEMAVRDAVWSMDTTLVILGEPFGLKISKEETPAIYEVLTRGITTIENIRFRPKAYYFRIRPFAYFQEPSIFPQDDEWLATEGSYPSGHTIRAWACALLMAQINPNSAEAVFHRAWQSGESRVISGCHWQSDVDASRPVAGIGYSRLQTNPEFQKAMAKAQLEFQRISGGNVKTTASSKGIGDYCTLDSLKYNGETRRFWIHVPEKISDAAPLMVCLHGYGGDAALKGKVQLVELADREGFVICFPQGLRDPRGKTGWNVGYPAQEGMKTDDVGFVEKLVRTLQKQYSLDKRNAFLVGMSNGGEMCYLMARRKPDLFAGLISIAGLTLECMTPLSYKNPVPFMEVHGTADKTSYWTGDHTNAYGWGEYLSVPTAISYVVAANGCSGYSKETLPDTNKPVILHKYIDGRPARGGKGRSTEVWLYEVQGGTHSWADKEMDTYAQIWAFMSRFMY
jgi:polyhydroxybutyrate depolymerase